jgi:hypothetical protein
LEAHDVIQGYQVAQIVKKPKQKRPKPILLLPGGPSCCYRVAQTVKKIHSEKIQTDVGRTHPLKIRRSRGFPNILVPLSIVQQQNNKKKSTCPTRFSLSLNKYISIK